ncbi:beta-lactamase/transpeptidase-like protein [Naematelia encephala]|uniref:Beta-lactamase/transpeptidase-like protein n=1 Tax=Naematelia encephala TaxID=71784 RepID=A0A1Y2BJX6_9TREE|nr:beta-lactamase/transpeptidase-like protein [Naematelia encephala]
MLLSSLILTLMGVVDFNSSFPQRIFSSSRPQGPLLSATLTSRLEHLRKKYGIAGINLSLSASPKYTGEDWANETLHLGHATASGDVVTADTLWGIASISKIFVVLAIGMLINNGTALPSGEELDWSTKIKDIMPEWKLMDEYASDHTDLIDLMNMRSGLPRHDFANGIITPSEVISRLRYFRPSSELRQNFQYNNWHYVTLSHIVPTLTGVPYINYVSEHIFKPLNMTQTTYNATEALLGGHRTESWFHDGVNATECAQHWKGLDNLDKSCIGQTKSIGWWTDSDQVFMAGPGGLIMSGRDMVKWLSELLSPRVIPSNVLAKATRPLTTRQPSPYPGWSALDYGLGQWVFSFRGHEVHGHTGGLPGQYSVTWRAPERGIALFIANNDEGHGELVNNVMASVIFDELLGLEPRDWESIILEKALSQVPNTQTPPKHTRESPKVDQVAGRYTAEGYGHVDLIPLLLPAELKMGIHLNTSQIATEVQNSLDAALPLRDILPPLLESYPHLLSKSTNMTLYYAITSKLLYTHLIFSPFDGPIYNWTAVLLKPVLDKAGQPTDEVIFSHPETGSAVFVEGSEGGFGMFGDYWGQGAALPGSRITEVNVKDQCEVWYARA